MTKYLAAGMLGYLIGVKHKWLTKELCWSRMKKHAHRLMRML